MIVVIPAYNEPNILETLNSLKENDIPLYETEVIVVLNYGEQADNDIKKNTAKSLIQLQQWIQLNNTKQLKFYTILAANLPEKHAGVGLARKIGMDEAVRRFEQIKTNGIIVNLDADCTVSKNYFNTIYQFYNNQLNIQAANIHFEHDIETVENNEAIILYELYLRYYIEALRYASYPFAYHTVGSCFSVKSKLYQLQGGMNKRKAGEDFYFLHKIIPTCYFAEITEATVYPSSRESDRVPFGTGRSILEWRNHQRDLTTSYSLKSFQLVRHLFVNPLTFKNDMQFEMRLPKPLQTYLQQIKFSKKINEILSNTSNDLAFTKRYHRFWTGFEILKLIHYLRDHFYEQEELVSSCIKLFGIKAYYYDTTAKDVSYELLLRLRNQQKKASH